MCAKTLVRFSFVMAAMLILVAGCARCSHKNGSVTAAADVRAHIARLSEVQAISIARHAAEREGKNLANYKDPEAHFEFIEKDQSWSILFDGKVPIPGNHFLVEVDDQTESTRVMMGQ